MKKTKEKVQIPWNYQPLHKIRTKVITKLTKKLGTIKQIDNVCNWRDHKRAVPEYYIKWDSGAWTRHECDILDKGYEIVYTEIGPDKIVALSSVGKLIYGK